MMKRAFTILELVAVLVIIGILAGLGAVTYSTLISDADASIKDKTAAAELRSAYATTALNNKGVVLESDLETVVTADASGVFAAAGVTVVVGDGSTVGADDAVALNEWTITVA